MSGAQLLTYGSSFDKLRMNELSWWGQNMLQRREEKNSQKDKDAGGLVCSSFSKRLRNMALELP
jgi:hypothetical protein